MLKKNLIALVLILLLTMMVLSACDSNKEADSETAAVETTNATDTTEMAAGDFGTPIFLMKFIMMIFLTVLKRK